MGGLEVGDGALEEGMGNIDVFAATCARQAEWF